MEATAPFPTRPGSVKAWIMACRPPTLTAAASPVIVGSACAHAAGGFRAAPAAAALVGALLLQIGSNLANDVFDYEKGADTADRLGPLRAAQAGLLSPRELKSGMVVVFGLAFAVGAYLVAVAGLPIVAIGLASIVSAIAYTGGPYPLGYHGLGDVFVMAFFGFIAVCGTAFAQTGHVPPLAWIASVPVGSLATAILVVNNVRDCETDVKAGKRTLPVRFGRRTGLVEYTLLVGGAYLVPAALATARVTRPWVLLPLLTLPVARRLVGHVWNDTGRALNASLVGTARLLFVHSVLFALGVALGAL
jgi:1,4-dihydroxy-2-naphthoate octaprenyltransferase